MLARVHWNLAAACLTCGWCGLLVWVPARFTCRAHTHTVPHTVTECVSKQDLACAMIHSSAVSHQKFCSVTLLFLLLVTLTHLYNAKYLQITGMSVSWCVEMTMGAAVTQAQLLHLQRSQHSESGGREVEWCEHHAPFTAAPLQS
jgi:hypothetical protein